MSTAAINYEAAADKLVQRMLQTFEAHPDAAQLDDVWKMLKVPGFNCDDIGPSLFQAGWAFSMAKKLWRERPTPSDSQGEGGRSDG